MKTAGANARRPSLTDGKGEPTPTKKPKTSTTDTPSKAKATTAAANTSTVESSVNTSGVMQSKKPQYGRRASRRESGAAAEESGVKSGNDSGWFEAGKNTNTTMNKGANITGATGDGANASVRHKVKDAIPQNLKTVGDEDTNATASAALVEKQREEKEKVAKAVADAPTGYQAQMPLLTDLDIKNNWDKLLQTVHAEFDMSCLTSCLARELDEDVSWNPEMLLVQLTSDMHDAAELKGDEANFMPVEESEIGLMRGGEVTRKRREKHAADESPPVPQSNKPAGPGEPHALSPVKRRASNAKVALPAAAAKGSESPGASGKAAAPAPAKKSEAAPASRKLSAKETSPRKAGNESVNKAVAARKKSKDATGGS